MGQEIVYCFKCQKRIVSSDFEKGLAFQAENNFACATCAVQLLEILGPRQKEVLLAKMFKATQERRQSSTSHIPKVPPSEGLPSPEHPAPRRVVLPPSDPPSGGVGVVIGLAVAGAAVLLFIFLAREKPSPNPGAETGGSRPIPNVGTSAPRNESPEEQRRLQKAQEVIRKARAFAQDHPADADGQVAAWQEALEAAENTPYLAEARREHAASLSRRKESMAKEFVDLDARLKSSQDKENFREALGLIEQARSKRSAAEWAPEFDRRMKSLEERAEKLLGPLKEQAVDARKRGSDAEPATLRARVERWGLAKCLSDFDLALAKATPDKTPVTPPTPPDKAPSPPPKEALEYRTKWDSALARAASRDYAAAIQELSRALEGAAEPAVRAEAQADLEGLRSVQNLLRESGEVLAKLLKGQNVALEYFSAAGPPMRAEGILLRNESFGLTLKQAAGTLSIPTGELTPGFLAEQFKARPQRKPEDDRSAVLFCLVEGDPEAARRLQGGAPASLAEKYWNLGTQLAEARRRPEIADREVAARREFYAAEAGVLDYSKTAESVAAFARLLSQQGTTGFVARNRALITARAGAGKDYLFFPALLRGAGAFKYVKAGKMEACWSSEKDSEASKIAENYVEIVYSALPDQEYRCWVYAGACCLETFAFSAQATGLTVPNPRNAKEIVAAEAGSPFTAPVKVTLSLKKSHASHGGPKTPARWEWIPLPLPKPQTAGVKTIRLLSDQQGFSVAYAVVSSTRASAPREAELKEAESSRPDITLVPTISPVAPDDRAWKPLFDGKSLDFLSLKGYGGWKVEDGMLVKVVSSQQQAVIAEEIGDGELRIRFDAKGAVFRFSVRILNEGRSDVIVNSADYPAGEHELRIDCRKDAVSATIDGKVVSVKEEGKPGRPGSVAFNSQFGEFRIRSLEFRPAR